MILVLGHREGKLWSPYRSPTKCLVRQRGEAKGWFWMWQNSGPRYYLRQRQRREGCRMGVKKECRREGEKQILRLAAGQAKKSPNGCCSLSLIIRPIKEHTKLPPAESPARMILFGLMLQREESLVVMNLYTASTSQTAAGKRPFGGIEQSTDKTGILRFLDQRRVYDCVVQLESEMKPPPWKCRIISLIYGSSLFDDSQQLQQLQQLLQEAGSFQNRTDSSYISLTGIISSAYYKIS